MYWTGETVAVPGKNINLKAVIKNVTFLKFPFDFNKIAYRVLIDGEVFFEDDLFLFYDSNYTYIPSYKVPAGRTTPIQFTIVLDPYDQLDESNEENNTATIIIPIQNTGSTGPDFSISAGDLSYISRPILPGSQIKLSAAILNNSKSLLLKDLRVHFKVNGTIVSNFTVSKGSLGPLKYCLVTKNWTVPGNLPAGSKFEVVLDPADPDRDFPGENASDNTASIILDTYSPDLEVTADCLSWLPKEPQAGSSVTLYAGIRNTGLSPTY
jgi:archaellum component FlaG (FlaF/FlaG flagellin family)